jgi:hypothetical protein
MVVFTMRLSVAEVVLIGVGSRCCAESLHVSCLPALQFLAWKRGRGGSLVTRNWFAHRALYSMAIGVK